MKGFVTVAVATILCYTALVDATVIRTEKVDEVVRRVPRENITAFYADVTWVDPNRPCPSHYACAWEIYDPNRELPKRWEVTRNVCKCPNGTSCLHRDEYMGVDVKVYRCLNGTTPWDQNASDNPNTSD